MSTLEKLQSLIIFIAILFGLLLGQIAIISKGAGYIIMPFLFLMLFAIFINIPLKDFKKSLSNFRFTTFSLIINFIWTPILAYILGYMFLSNNSQLWIGFIMLLVTPCTDWYLMFTDMAKGNVPLGFSTLPLNLILQIVLLPVYLLLFTGVNGGFDINMLFESIIYIIILPFLLAQIGRYILSKEKFIKKSLDKKILGFFKSIQIIFLSLAIFAMFASQGNFLTHNLGVILLLLTPFLIFFIVNFLLVRVIAKFSKMKHDEYVSLSLTTLARNSPISLAIAVVAFPNNPLISLALVIAPLIELPILTIVSQLLLLLNKGKNENR
ncbi:arsenic resistance protein [Methanobrevibacter filiformis]|uniref:Sodium bile acid symporter family protein n=1 Tax=Methanobrevibacter filiformis TaxID=55758 RepID=A0A166DCR7_9EURY|nr:bile acid:sodium symporter [Methanobrevibacter filiformis]KZX15451.1 sodium bile acid symporter family protein [Methanobrevibacter filiformis]